MGPGEQGGPTDEAAQVFCTVSISHSLSGKVASVLVESFANLNVLAALEAARHD